MSVIIQYKEQNKFNIIILTYLKSYTVYLHYKLSVSATETHSDTPMWRNERIVAMAMIPLIPAAIAFPSMPLDFALSTAMVLHCHW